MRLIDLSVIIIAIAYLHRQPLHLLEKKKHGNPLLSPLLAIRRTSKRHSSRASSPSRSLSAPHPAPANHRHLQRRQRGLLSVPRPRPAGLLGPSRRLAISRPRTSRPPDSYRCRRRWGLLWLQELRARPFASEQGCSQMGHLGRCVHCEGHGCGIRRTRMGDVWGCAGWAVAFGVVQTDSGATCGGVGGRLVQKKAVSCVFNHTHTHTLGHSEWTPATVLIGTAKTLACISSVLWKVTNWGGFSGQSLVLTLYQVSAALSILLRSVQKKKSSQLSSGVLENVSEESNLRRLGWRYELSQDSENDWSCPQTQDA